MDGPTWLWERPELLTAGEWRSSETAVPGVPTTRSGRHLMLSIYGEQWRFRRPERIDALLRTMERRLDLDPEMWREQRPFFQALFQQAFDKSSLPGWLTVTRDRGDFAARVTLAGASGNQRTVARRRLFPLRFQESRSVRVGGRDVAAGSARMWYRDRSPSRDLSWYELTVERSLRGDGLGPAIRTHETWMFLGNRSTEERELRRQGVNPLLRELGRTRGLGAEPVAGDGPVHRDAVGNILADGDSVTIVKGLKVKGAGAPLKVGTKVRNIRLVDDDHNIECKIDGFGPVKLKSEFVKKS